MTKDSRVLTLFSSWLARSWATSLLLLVVARRAAIALATASRDVEGVGAADGEVGVDVDIGLGCQKSEVMRRLNEWHSRRFILD